MSLKHNLGSAPTAPVIDVALTRELVSRFLRGCRRGELDFLFCGVVFHFMLKAADLPKAVAARKGYRRSTTENARGPVCFERLVLIIDWMLREAAATKSPRFIFAAAWAL